MKMWCLDGISVEKRSQVFFPVGKTKAWHRCSCNSNTWGCDVFGSEEVTEVRSGQCLDGRPPGELKMPQGILMEIPWRWHSTGSSWGGSGLEETMEKANQQWSEGLVCFCRGCFPGETGLNHLWLFQKQGGSYELREMERFIPKTTPMQKTAKQNKQKTAKSDKT